MFASPEILQFVADEMQHLEDLPMHSFNGDRNKNEISNFHFEHVKIFRMGGCFSSDNFQWDISFSNLEEFQTDGVMLNGTKLVKLIKKNKQKLKKLYLDTELKNSAVLELANVDLDVVEMRFKCGRDVEMENVIQLIENYKKLEKLYIYYWFDVDRQSAIDALQNVSFAHEWNIDEREKFVFLERKTPFSA